MTAELAPGTPPPHILPELRPSEYTAALIQALQARPGWMRGARALEIGSGSGVILAAVGALGAASLCGVDIERDAVVSGARLLHDLGYDDVIELHHGDMWEPIAGRRFDLIAANLPHFPMPARQCGGRLPSWSSGGPDGRRLLDRFLEGLPMHLAPPGRAVITHNAFVDVERSRSIVARYDLSLRIAATRLVHISTEKLSLMTPGILSREEGRSIHRYGPYAFAEVLMVEIGDAASLA